MIDPADRVLLVNLRFADGFDGWMLPGGGVEEGEDHRAALIRELTEETGAPEVFVGPVLWHQTSLRPGMGGGRWSGQRNTTYLVPCHEFDAAPTMSAEEQAGEGLVDVRWWSVEEIEAAASNVDRPDVIRPDGLAELVALVLEHGAPMEALDLGIVHRTRPTNDEVTPPLG